MDKTPKTFEELIALFQTNYPDIPIREQPSYSLKELLNFEETYKMNTDDAIKKRVELDEAVYHDDIYDYLLKWESAYRIYQIHRGDLSKINQYK